MSSRHLALGHWPFEAFDHEVFIPRDATKRIVFLGYVRDGPLLVGGRPKGYTDSQPQQAKAAPIGSCSTHLSTEIP